MYIDFILYEVSMGLFYRSVNQKLILKFKKVNLEIFNLRNSRVKKCSKFFDQFIVFGLVVLQHFSKFL